MVDDLFDLTLKIFVRRIHDFLKDPLQKTSITNEDGKNELINSSQLIRREQPFFFSLVLQ